MIEWTDNIPPQCASTYDVINGYYVVYSIEDGSFVQKEQIFSLPLMQDDIKRLKDNLLNYLKQNSIKVTELWTINQGDSYNIFAVVKA